MEMLDTKVMIYDDTCPMCSWYTQKFVDAGVLPPTGRRAFSQLDSQTTEMLDFNRSRHEIPLIDTRTQTVIYGLDAFLLLFTRLFPMLKNLLLNPRFKAIVKPFYHFVSYNRRIVVGANAQTTTSPDFHLGWRLTFIGFMQLLVLCLHSLIIKWYFYTPNLNFFLIAACINLPNGIPVIWAGLSNKMTRENTFDFWANWLTTNFLASILTLPYHLLLFIVFQEKMLALLFSSALLSQVIHFHLIEIRVINNKFPDGVSIACFRSLVIQFLLFVLPSMMLLAIFR